ncbi:Ureide permease [Heracleum sosnowskyi]|uniref:Ureide permease n=1 Tax=Heracleum sosnowskyi TaxID=360622 RepID=A0AAD8ITL9_9APIA|nr:Ureide permease [Heracleum sosnowskyi]
MYVVESRGGAIACMLLSLLLLGTWPALFTLLESRGRLPQHTYLDYTITNFLAALVIAFTFGEIGESTAENPDFLVQLSQVNWPSVLFAMAGGAVLSLGNLATQYALAFVGLSVTNVMTASITVVIGTTFNYFLDDKINRAEILFPGVGCFLIAVCFASGVHASNATDNEAKLKTLANHKIEEIGDLQVPLSKKTSPISVGRDIENVFGTTENAKVGTCDFLLELENRRAIKVFGKSTYIGLGITFFAGLCFSLFSPAFNLATNDQWDTLREDWDGRGWASLAGLLCGFGNGLQFIGGQAAGYAAADAVQAFPLVSTFWGIILFGEYRRSSRRTYILLSSMLLMFILAVGILMASSGQRKQVVKFK